VKGFLQAANHLLMILVEMDQVGHNQLMPDLCQLQCQIQWQVKWLKWMQEPQALCLPLCLQILLPWMLMLMQLQLAMQIHQVQMDQMILVRILYNP
jgi:hypothetical protein